MSSSLFTRFITFPYIFWQVTENKSQCLFKQISRGKTPQLLRCKLFYKHVKLKQNACNNRRPRPTPHTALTAAPHLLRHFRSVSCHTHQRSPTGSLQLKLPKNGNFCERRSGSSYGPCPLLSSPRAGPWGNRDTSAPSALTYTQCVCWIHC